jgi:uncharacterized protein
VVKLSLRSGDKRFFLLLQQAAANVVKMGKEFQGLLNDWDYLKERVDILDDLEHDGDAITHDIQKMLYRSFITPLDREDISLVARTIDDIADRIHSAADVILLYRVDVPTAKAKEIVEVIVRSTVEVEKAVQLLNSEFDHEELRRRGDELNQIEKLGDQLYREAVADLYENETDDLNIVKWRKIYELMESAVDGCEAVAGALESVAIKYT